MDLRSLLDKPMPGLELLTGSEQLGRPIRWVVTTDLIDPGRYLSGGELVLTGLVWRRGPGDSERFVAALAEAEASGLAAGDASGADIPADLVRACREHRIPLFRVPPELAFATLTEHLARKLSAQRAGDIGSVLDRHRRLASASAAGPALDPILELIAQDVGMACWVVTSSGRAIAGSHGELAEADRLRLAHGALRAATLPARIGPWSVFAMGGGHRLTDWYLVFDGDFTKWEPQHQSLAAKVATVLAIERERLESRGEPVRRLGAELVRLIAEDGEPAEINARMGLLNLDTEAEVQAVAAAGADSGPASGSVARTAAVLRTLLEGLVEPDFPVAEFDDHIGALVPAPAGDLAELLRARLADLAPGLGRDRLAIGVSSRRTGALPGAVDEARHALRIGRARPAPVSVVGHHELASHVLLLAGVPEDIRTAYRDRLLGPLRAYDAKHRSDLEATLETFLACSTSWTRCAEAMHVHVNTLRYRITRIEELTGRDLGDLETQVDLFLALRLR